jgi:putative permease
MSESLAGRDDGQISAASTRTAAIRSEGLSYAEVQRAAFRSILLAAGLFVIYELAAPLTTLLLFFLLVFILAAALNPVVSQLQRLGIPRAVSALGLLLFFLASLALLGWLVVPPLLDELSGFFANVGKDRQELVSAYRDLLSRYPQLGQLVPAPDVLLRQLAQSLAPFLGRVGRHTINAAIALLSLLLLLVLLIFTLARPEPLVAGFLSVVPERYRGRVVVALRRILAQLQAWALGSLVLGLIVGTMAGVGLRLLGVPHALLFGVIAGIGEVVPNVGPILSAIPPMLMALTIDPLLALWVALLFTAVQQLENYLIVPLVMGQTLRLHPISVTFAILMMGALFGLLGAVLAMPICAMVKVCWEEFYLRPKGISSESLEAAVEEVLRTKHKPP